MSSFKEYLEDYEKEELDRIERSLKKLEQKLKKGKASLNDIYPSADRFIELKKPIAYSPVTFPIWGVIPFYGSTVVPIIPRWNKDNFDYVHKFMGFSSKDIDRLIDLTKETGRIQFVLKSRPTHYKNLEFLEPLFYEIKPPSVPNIAEILIGEKIWRKLFIEFDTIAKLNFYDYIKPIYSDNDYIKQRIFDYAYDYIVLKFMGYNQLIEDIELLMITDPLKASHLFWLFGNIVAVPIFNPLRIREGGIHNFSIEELTELYEVCKKYGIEPPQTIPCEIGKFVLEKLVRYPLTYDGCWEIIQHYDDNDLYKVLNALNEGVRKSKVDIIEDKKQNLEEILENIWKETKKIKMKAEIVRICIGVVGELSASLSGIGILAGLGFAAVDKIVSLKEESIGEKVAKLLSPNYIVTIYDFKKKYRLHEYD